MTETPEDVVLTVSDLIRTGGSPVKLYANPPDRRKAPVESGWTRKNYDMDRADEQAASFSGYNVGLRLDGGLVDIDLDCDEAVRFGRQLLPDTGMKHGRDGTTRHYWYVVDHEDSHSAKINDPATDTSIIEWRTGHGQQTAIPPSLHPNGKQLHWELHKPPGPATLVDYHLLRKRFRWVAAFSLIARHWPESGLRHDVALAYCGGAAGIDDPELHAIFPRMLSQAAEAAGDEEARSRGYQQWNSTKTRVDNGEEVTSWGTLITELGILKPVIDRVEELLTPEEVPEEKDEHRFRNMEIHDILRGKDVPPYPVLIDGLCYEKGLHWVKGEGGDGKTIWVLSHLVDLIKQGRNVAIIDEENNPHSTAKLLFDLGLNDEQGYEDHLYYFHQPSLDWKADVEGRKKLLAEIRAAKPEIVMIDTSARLFQNATLDENLAFDFGILFRYLFNPLMDETAVIVIDHVVKNSDYSRNHARGTTSKRDDSTVMLHVKKTKKFDEQTVGEIEVENIKARYGQFPHKTTWKIGSESIEAPLIVQRIAREGTGGNQNHYVDLIVDFIKSHAPDSSKMVNTSDILEGVGKNRNQVSNGLKQIREGVESYPVRVVQQGKAILYHYDAGAGERGVELDFSEEPAPRRRSNKKNQAA